MNQEVPDLDLVAVMNLLGGLGETNFSQPLQLEKNIAHLCYNIVRITIRLCLCAVL